METAEKRPDTYSMRVTPDLIDELKELAARYPSKIDFANDIIARLNDNDNEKDNKIRFLEGQVEHLKSQISTNPMAEISKDNVIVPVTPFRRKCLNYILERERKYLGAGSELNEATVYNYILDEILIEGNKFSIKSIPDSKIDQFKEETQCLEN